MWGISPKKNFENNVQVLGSQPKIEYGVLDGLVTNAHEGTMRFHDMYHSYMYIYIYIYIYISIPVCLFACSCRCLEKDWKSVVQTDDVSFADRHELLSQQVDVLPESKLSSIEKRLYNAFYYDILLDEDQQP